MAEHETKVLSIRIPAELVEEVRRLAERERRSLNAQITVLIERALAQQQEREREKGERG